MYRVLCKDLEIQDIYDMPWVSEESGAQGERDTHIKMRGTPRGKGYGLSKTGKAI